MSHVSQRTSHVTRFRRLARLSPLPLFLAALAPAPASAATGGDHLTVTVRDAGDRSATYEVRCHPGRGSHPDLAGACAAVDRNTRWGRDTFAPVPDGSVCTMLYGGPATAHVTGTWAGRPVDARFDRSNGCETARWNRFVPLLPDMRT
ncbi:SSI family serine proteinase inhibitor [Streptomyces griseorubiginosus]|uniref:SSI family serine proteinase inhibitor n=1 Tax=Streptomyces griseorubiginosus TaxID=67304 RepID=UPI0033B6AF1E